MRRICVGPRCGALIVVAAVLAWPAGARADAIDGDWCRGDGKRMTIRGPDIVTPAGKQTRGEYTRHNFSYVVPADEAGAGATVQIVLRGEYLALSRQGENTEWQEWRRCSATTS
jgi:hypothetical protein